MSPRVLPVSTINAYIRDVVTSDELLSDIWIEGEITKSYTPRSGHIYFTICEGDASIDGVMWRSAAQRQRFLPRQGEAVVIHGQADFYQTQGRLQIVTDVFEHQGQGILALQFERLRQQLEAEGLFDPSRKRSLPLFPRRVGVVTSSTGAVWHDIQTVSRRRFPLVELILIPASVQGEHAPRQLADAIRFAGEMGDLDALIVGRGGGSPEDLAPFNSEIVARALFASTVPTVSAVGHETDISICDMVADLRAATPSAAAEMILPDGATLYSQLLSQQLDMTQIASRTIVEAQQNLESLHRRLRLQSPLQQVAKHQLTLSSLQQRLVRAMTANLGGHTTRTAALETVLQALNPYQILRRGYVMIHDETTGKPIRSVRSLPSDGRVFARFHDGVASGMLATHSDSEERHYTRTGRNS